MLCGRRPGFPLPSRAAVHPCRRAVPALTVQEPGLRHPRLCPGGRVAPSCWSGHRAFAAGCRFFSVPSRAAAHPCQPASVAHGRAAAAIAACAFCRSCRHWFAGPLLRPAAGGAGRPVRLVCPCSAGLWPGCGRRRCSAVRAGRIATFCGRLPAFSFPSRAALTPAAGGAGRPVRLVCPCSARPPGRVPAGVAACAVVPAEVAVRAAVLAGADGPRPPAPGPRPPAPGPRALASGFSGAGAGAGRAEEGREGGEGEGGVPRWCECGCVCSASVRCPGSCGASGGSDACHLYRVSIDFDRHS